MTEKPETKAPQSELVSITRAQHVYADWMTAVLVYTVILNLFVEHSSAFVIDSFTISVLTAIVLKALLAVIVRFEHRVAAFFRPKQGLVYRVLGIVSTIAILFFSKFIILEIIDIIFREHVEIKGFIPMVALIITLLIGEQVVHRVYDRLGQVD